MVNFPGEAGETTHRRCPEVKMILYSVRNNGNIDEICDEIHSKMLAVRIDKSIALKFKLYLENIFIDLTDKQITNFQVEVWKQYCSITQSVSKNTAEKLIGFQELNSSPSSIK
jgi:uncharacterized OsmC-like protein